jgi:hypothetical protein
VAGSPASKNSGEAATVTDSDVGPFIFNGFPPFMLTPSGFAWGGEGGSFVDYNGFGYGVSVFPGVPFASVQFSEFPVGPAPTITGPGFYPMTFSPVLELSLFDSSHQLFHSESDTAFATGGITYTDSGIPGNTYVFGGPLQGSIPEPSTRSYILLAGFCLGIFARFKAFRGAQGVE